MRIDIITVLPEMLEGFVNESILARAQKKALPKYTSTTFATTPPTNGAVWTTIRMAASPEW